MKAIASLLLFLSLPPILAPAQFLMRPHRFAAGSVTQDFDGYTPVTSLSTLPGWTETDGDFSTIAGGTVSSNGSLCVAAYEPAGFTTSANHQAEVTLAGTSSTATGAQGVAAAIQGDGSCYIAFLDGDGPMYFGYVNAAGSDTDYLSAATGTSGTQTGVKIRMTVSGTGASRVCTAEYNSGGGWVTPSGFGNRDFGTGKRLDGGDAGISGFGGTFAIKITSLTITNQ